MDPYFGPRRRPIPWTLIIVVAFVLGAWLGRSGRLLNSAGEEPADVRETFRPFWETWNLVQKRFVDRKMVKPQPMMEGAIQGMLASLGDGGHTTYVDREEFQQLQESLKGELYGIGARVTLRERRVVIVQTMPNSPARLTGLRPGDAILEVNEKPTVGLSLDRVVEQVRGPAGTSVHLTILRHGKSKPIDFEIKRARVDVRDVNWQLLPDGKTVHIALQDFGMNADKQLRASIEDARKEGARGLLIDVRGNFGGLKEQAVAVSSEFLRDGIVFREEDSQGNQEQIPVSKGGIATEIPMCVLIDDGTASAAEIFAGAIQDHHRATLVGTRTFGTGTVLQPFRLSDGSAVLLAIAEWFTPDGRQIWHKGIKPDVEVVMPANAALMLPETGTRITKQELAQSSDKQFLKALDLLNQQLKEKTEKASP